MAASELRMPPAKPLLKRTNENEGTGPRSQEQARRPLRLLADPRHGDNLGRVEDSPPGFSLEPDEAVVAKLHAGQLLVLVRGDADVPDPADDQGKRPGLADERLQQIADRLTRHETHLHTRRPARDDVPTANARSEPWRGENTGWPAGFGCAMIVETGGGPGMQDFKAIAQRAAAALQEWYAADPYASKTGLYSYRDPSADVSWKDWSALSRIRDNMTNGVMTLSGRRYATQAMAHWWNSANALTALIGYMAATGDRSYVQPVVENTFTRAAKAYRPINTQLSVTRPFDLNLASYPGFINAFYDDEGWWALAWLSAYDLTGDEKYLASAKDIFTDMALAWDETWGGGIYWGKHAGQPDRSGVTAVPRGWKGPYKNAIANELFIAVAGALGLRSQNRKTASNDHENYARWARRGWEWFSSPPPQGVALINQNNLVNDSPNNNGVNDNTKGVWSYNQGVILSGLCDLAELTGDQAYLERAENIATAFIANRWHV